MKGQIITREVNITFLQGNLLKKMHPADVTEVVLKAEELLKYLPEIQGTDQSKRGLIWIPTIRFTDGAYILKYNFG